jgi:hypothetical protein
LRAVSRNKDCPREIDPGVRIFSKPINLIAAFVAGALVIPVASVSRYPARRLRATDDGSKPILTGAAANPAVLEIVARSCQNCHSEKTEWPWYSYVTPMSWMIAKDVKDARSHMNLTNWQNYSPEERFEMLSEIMPLVRNKIMPPSRYLALHPEAKLSARDIEVLVEWVNEERRKQ